MKRINFYALLLVLSAMTFISCDPENKPFVEPVDLMANAHFDVWTPQGGIAMLGKNDYIVKRTNTLDSGEMSVQGSGVDLSKKLFGHTIVKGKYYYQLTQEGRFGKYQIGEGTLNVVKEFPFTTLKDRRYSHAWTDDKTLVLIGCNGDATELLWVKIDVEMMKPIAEGKLTLPRPPEGQKYNTSGMLAYRKADNKLLYSFVYKKIRKGGTTPAPEFYMAFINPADMTTEKVVANNRAEFMASTAYGELRQTKSFFDEKGDFYIACNSVLPGEKNGSGKVTTTAQRGSLFRIKSGEMDFDASYNGYTQQRGKIVGLYYLNNGKALLYMQDPKYADASKEPVWDNTNNPYVFYWLMVDLTSTQLTDFKGKLPLTTGNFVEGAVVVGSKAYIAINGKNMPSTIYSYDIASGNFTKGMTMAEGFPVERIAFVKN
ncbi:MAG: hypothetical protein CSA89_01315 [Bacteroidales bacterium]|nr:MAG: hypothetical protein CSA89_01315 [Bacteroidales bacterium]